MKVVVTGGGTVAPIDDVRYIANVSSGRFSAAISEECLRLGAEVRHIHAPRALLPFHRLARFDLETPTPDRELNRLTQLRDEWELVRHRLQLIPLAVGTVKDYADTLRQSLLENPADLIFLAMAVSDFEPEPLVGKINSQLDEVIIRARRTDKVIRSVRDWSPSSYLVGFKLLSNVETSELIRVAELACRLNRADLTVANDLKGLQQGRHTVHLVRPGHEVETLGPRPDLARELVQRVVSFRDGQASR
jgi:phosphopantothenate---cysteine ligase (CTP)